MHRWLLLLLMLSCNSIFASVTLQKRLTINAELSINTCALSLSPANINFQQVGLSQLENNATAPQTVDLNIACSWPASGITIKFSPAAGVSASDTKLMKTGLSGVGLALSWKENGSTDFTPKDFNSSFAPVVTTLSDSNATLGQFQLLPKKIPEETLQAGNISTSLTVEVTYD
ncbi:TPA: fimbrial protein [Citrobacter amalonaticus]|uniref:fimbrial protein n=1 Tax=Citrobacter amalonaticus TaxID=35703 RepID=UPI000F66862F|nr:fimbrial protein [Citrobacter amalonaticus]RSC57665.1 fimbrial protein [Citrobacter amalonaticus]